MRSLFAALALLLCTPAARADDDPPGTTQLSLHLNSTQLLPSPPGSTAVCDDPAVVVAEVTEQGLALRGVSIGTTLCGLRGPAGQQVGVLRVKVIHKPKTKKKRAGDEPDGATDP